MTSPINQAWVILKDIPTMNLRRCPTCLGDGELPIDDIRDSDGYYEFEKCPMCKGQGKVPKDVKAYWEEEDYNDPF